MTDEAFHHNEEVFIDETKLTIRDITLLTYREIKDIKPRVESLEKDMMTIKLAQASQKSFFDGAKAMWGFILALPVGAIGLLVGTQT